MKTCLLIDDDREDREFFSSVLAIVCPGIELLTVADAESARKLLRENVSPDYIFLDLFLPGIDGYEFLLQLKRDINHRRIPVIVYSVVNDNVEISKIKKYGALDFFVKSAEPSELQRQLERYFGES